MKECPICHTQYDDRLNFCTKDGHQLKSAEISHVETPNSKNIRSCQQQKTKTGCLKKIIISFVILIIGTIALYNYFSNATTYLRTEPNEVYASKAGGTCKIDIDYDGYVWQVNHKPDWVHIDEFEQSFEITVEKNETGQSREGSITIQSGKQLAQVVITQNGVATYIKTSEDSFSFNKEGGKVSVTVESDGCDWFAEYPKYLNVNKEDETTLEIEVPTNTSNYRTGYITIKEYNVSCTINFTQGGKCPNCDGAGESDCGGCFGSGSTGFGFYVSQCFVCGGKGKMPCSRCNGTGEIE